MACNWRSALVPDFTVRGLLPAANEAFTKVCYWRWMRFQSTFPASRSGSKPGVVLAGAAAFGILVGICSLAVSDESLGAVKSWVGSFAADLGVGRARSPQAGDVWSSCSQARDAGTVPIYRGEPGYHEELDYDQDGVACESNQLRNRHRGVGLRLRFGKH
jgi:hypothetical protein